MKKKLVTMMLTLTMVVSMIACGVKAEAAVEESSVEEVSEEGAAEETEGKRWKVGVFSSNAATSTAAYYFSRFEEHAKDFDMDLYFFSADGDASRMSQQIIDCTNQGFDALIVNVYNPPSQIPAFKTAYEAGLKICCFSSDIADEGKQYREFFCAADNIQAGIAAGEAFVEAFPDGAKILEIGTVAGSDSQNKRSAGFREAIEGSNIEILETMNVQQVNPNDAMNIMQNYIIRYGEDGFDGVYCYWDAGLAGCIQAMEQAGIDPTTKFNVGVDGNKDGFLNVKEGAQAVSIAQDFNVMTRQCLELLDTVLKGGEVDEYNWKPWDVVTAENVDDFPMPEW